MGLIGKEIVQSRVWVDPSAPAPPDLNYKYTYPITILEAVRPDMNDDSTNLKELLDNIYTELSNRQPILPSKSANYLMTFAGTPGGVGSIKISTDIPWDIDELSSDKIPTEKAVGEYMMKIGILNEDGSVNNGSGATMVRWSDIVGRPNVYTTLGNNNDGFITQDVVSESIRYLKEQIENNQESNTNELSNINKKLTDHFNAVNPHNITIGSLGGVSNAAFLEHTDASNPHNVTKSDVGLGNVDNTSDLDKPISNATKASLDALSSLITGLDNDVDSLKYVTSLEYDNATGALTWNYNTGDKLYLVLPLHHVIDDLSYDSTTKELVIVDTDGTESRVDVSDLFIRYLGSGSSNIDVTIEGDQITGDQKIVATIKLNSITEKEMADDSVITRIIKDEAVTGDKIKDLTITTTKLADGTVTTEKIKDLTITNYKLADRSVNGRTIFSSTSDEKLLAVKVAGEDPMWTQATEGMIANNAIVTRHLSSRAVTSDKLADKSVITARIDDLAVTNEKLADNAVTNEKVKTGSIAGEKLMENPLFTGVPRSTARPDADSNTNEIPDTRWVKDTIATSVLSNINLADRSVDGRTLFSSYTRNRVLIVGRALSDPEWGQINNDMMEDDSINTSNIIDRAVTTDKLDDRAVTSEKIGVGEVKLDNIGDGQVGLNKLWPSTDDNMVVASIKEGTSPIYTKIVKGMIGSSSIETDNIINGAVTPNKIEPSSEAQRVLVTNLAGSYPIWSQIKTNMIADRAVEGRNLFTSSVSNMILGVTTASTDPVWMKLKSEMIGEGEIKAVNIGEAVLNTQHIADRSITSEKIGLKEINTGNINDQAVTGEKLFYSEVSNRILGVGDAYSTPKWLQVNTDMVEDEAITADKLFRSKNKYRVLGTTNVNTPPEYLMITSDFIVDGSIISEKIERNIALPGTPEVTVHPSLDSDNFQIPSTAWVRKTITELIQNNDYLLEIADGKSIKDFSIPLRKLEVSTVAPRVLGVSKAGETVEYMMVETDMIADASVTTNKLQRSIHLLGSPVLEVRPAANACDYEGGGALIPDCQWVMERIREYAENGTFNGGSSGGSSGGSGGSTGDTGSNSGTSLYTREYIVSPMTTSEVDSVMDGSYVPDKEDEISFTSSDGISVTLSPMTSEEVDIALEDPDQIESSDSVTFNAVGKQVTFSTMSSTEISDIINGIYDPDDGEDLVFQITSAISNGYGGSTYIYDESIITQYIQDRAVTAEKLFTTADSNVVLAVIEPNTDPLYTKITEAMLAIERMIDGRRLFTSDTNNTVLGVSKAGEDPKYMKVNNAMLEDGVIKTDNIAYRAVTGDKIALNSITQEMLADDIEYDGSRIKDRSIINSNLANDSVNTRTIEDKSITSEKFADTIELPVATTVGAQTDLEAVALRNTVISHNAPSSCGNGVIWFRYS